MSILLSLDLSWLWIVSGICILQKWWPLFTNLYGNCEYLTLNIRNMNLMCNFLWWWWLLLIQVQVIKITKDIKQHVHFSDTLLAYSNYSSFEKSFQTFFPCASFTYHKRVGTVLSNMYWSKDISVLTCCKTLSAMRQLLSDIARVSFVFRFFSEPLVSVCFVIKDSV